MCFAPQRRALFRHLNLQKWREHVVFCTFWLRNVLRATTACTFSTSELPKVARTCSVLYIFTSKCASRHNGVHFFDISTSKSGPDLVCFVHFEFKMCFTPQRHALFQHRNFQKWSEPLVFLTFWLRNVLRATTPCNFSSLISPDVSAPAALASLLFNPPEPQNHEKTQCFATFLPFCAPAYSFFWSFLFWLFSLLTAFSSLHIVGSLTSKLPSMSLVSLKLTLIHFHDVPMIFPWYSHDISMIFPWFSMIFPWFSMIFHDISMIFPAYSMIFPRYFHDISMICPWHFHDISMIFPRNFHDIAMIFPWYVHDISMIFPRYFHDISTIFPWIFPWYFHGYFHDISIISTIFPWYFHDMSVFKSGISPYWQLSFRGGLTSQLRVWYSGHRPSGANRLCLGQELQVPGGFPWDFFGPYDFIEIQWDFMGFLWDLRGVLCDFMVVL